MHKIQINFPTKIFEALRKAAQDEGIGVGELLRRIVSEWLHKQDQR